MLAGVPMRNQDVLDLARLLRDARLDETADALIVALEAGQALIALSVQDREGVLRALGDPQTNSLAELCGVLLREHEWRVREGLV